MLDTTPLSAALLTRLRHRPWVALALVVWLGMAACDDGANQDDTDVSTDVIDTGGNDTSGNDTSGDDTGDDTCSLGELVTQVAGTIADEGSAPQSGAKVQLCVRLASTGLLRCLSPADSDMSGAFTIDVNAEVQCMESAVLRVFLPGADAATMYCEVEVEGQGPEVELTEPVVMYATTPATTLPAEGDGSTALTVVFADGLEIDVVPDRFYDIGPGYGALAARRLDDVQSDLCFLDGVPALDGVYAFSPEADVDEASFAMRIPNTTSLPANSSVSLFVLGGLDSFLPGDVKIDEAEWYEYGTGTVSAAGDVIEAELPYFSWFGYRAQ